LFPIARRAVSADEESARAVLSKALVERSRTERKFRDVVYTMAADEMSKNIARPVLRTAAKYVRFNLPDILSIAQENNGLKNWAANVRRDSL
jgi:hypothetical protein